MFTDNCESTDSLLACVLYTVEVPVSSYYSHVVVVLSTVIISLVLHVFKTLTIIFRRKELKSVSENRMQKTYYEPKDEVTNSVHT